MIELPIDQITMETIESLVNNKMPEGRTLEYKQELPGGTDKAKKEFLADVSSFANASGGDILYGITEERDQEGKTTGIPDEAIGLFAANLDELILGLEGSIRSNLDPRIVSQVVAIEGFSKGPVILIRVQQSWNGPHMVIFRGSSRFFSRTSRGKYQLDVSELRTAFTASEALPERINKFRYDRLSKIIADETPYSLLSGLRTVLHIVPLASFRIGKQADVAKRASELSAMVKPIYGDWNRHRFNFDGFVTGIEYKDSEYFGYTQIFRNGAVEATNTNYLQESVDIIKQLPIMTLEPKLIVALKNYLRLMETLGVNPPVLILVSLLNVKGYQIVLRGDFRRVPTPIERESIILPDYLVEEFSEPAAKVLRPVFDIIWQSTGYDACPNYDVDGNYNPRVREL